MRKVLTLGLFLLPAVLFAAEDSHVVLIKGKPLSRAVLVNGMWAIPLDDVAKGSGHVLTLEPGFQIQGTTLRVVQTSATGTHLKDGTITARTSGKSQAELMVFQPSHAGVITNNVLTLGGKRYVPLADFARAGGGIWTPAGLAPGASINLNFNNPNALLVSH